jgi:outer membrane protein TolC
MRYRLLIIVFWLAPLMSSVLLSASGQSASGGHEPRLTLEQAIAEAERQSPTVRAAAGLEQAAAQKATAASRTRFGQVDAVLGYWRYQDDQILRPMSSQLFGPRGFLGLPFDRDQLHYGLVFQAPLYAGGRLDATSRLAGLQTAQAALLLEGTRWEVRANIASLYSGVLSLEAGGRAVDRTLDALTATRRRLSLAVEQGKRPRLDLLKVDEELADSTARRAQIDAEAARVRSLLLATMGRDPSEDVDLEPLPDVEPQAIAPESDLKALVRASSGVRRGALQADQAGQAVRIAHSALLPSVAVRGNLMGNSALGIGEHLATWEVSLGVTVPVFNAGTKRADVAAARAQEQAALAGAERIALEREALLVEAQARLRAARQTWRAAHARVVAAEEAARIEQVRYDSGSSAIEDLLRARAREEASAAALAQGRSDLTVAAARLNAVCEREVVK